MWTYDCRRGFTWLNSLKHLGVNPDRPVLQKMGLTGLEVNDMTASVDPTTNTIKEYKVGVKIAFGVELS